MGKSTEESMITREVVMEQGRQDYWWEFEQEKKKEGVPVPDVCSILLCSFPNTRYLPSTNPLQTTPIHLPSFYSCLSPKPKTHKIDQKLGICATPDIQAHGFDRV